MRYLVLLLCVAMLPACANHNLKQYSQIDRTAKTITVPAGGKGLKGDIKDALTQRGWSMVVDRGPDIVEGSAGENTKLQIKDTFKTRYRLTVMADVYDLCINMSPAISYDVSVSDNLNGQEVFTLSGNGCQNHVVDRFIKAIGE